MRGRNKKKRLHTQHLERKKRTRKKDHKKEPTVQHFWLYTPPKQSSENR